MPLKLQLHDSPLISAANRQRILISIGKGAKKKDKDDLFKKLLQFAHEKVTSSWKYTECDAFKTPYDSKQVYFHVAIAEWGEQGRGDDR